MKHVFARRLGVLALGTTLALGSYVPAAQADASPSSSSATSWLAGQLTNGLMVNDQFDFTDIGLSIDAAFAAVASGDAQTATTIRDAVAADVESYLSFGANATAKTLVLAQRTGGDPRNFGGVDLVARLESLTQPSGRIQDPGEPNFASTLGQALAVEGLTQAGSSEAGAARAILLAQQCPAGFFRSGLAADAPCSADTDITSFALAALSGQQADPAVASAVNRAADWMISTESSGAYGGGGPTAAPNANSSGLAAAALGSVCRVAPAQRAATYVRGFQVRAGQTGALSNDVGVVAYDAAALATAQQAGIVTETRDQFRRATTQAATGLVWDASAAPSITLTGPGKRVAKGTTQTLTISGAARGETVCLTTPAGVQRLVGTGAPLTVPVTAPATGAAGYSATTGPGAATYALRTGNPKAQLKTKRVTAGGTVRIKLVSLVPGTKVVTKIRGTKVDRTRAKANGVATVKFRVTGKAAKAARVSTIRPGQVRKVTLKMKPARAKAVEKTLRVTRP